MVTTKQPQYRCIGRGFCGSIWTIEDDNPSVVIKREDGGPGRSVTNDYEMHLQTLQSALQYPLSTPISIPQCYKLVQSTDDDWWHPRLGGFPPGYLACKALVSERIPKVPRPISNNITDLFCADNHLLSNFVKNNVDDEACLIRPYLGRRRREVTRPSRFQRFSLRNVPLHINQMEEIGLDFYAYAETMADALALMHWGAQIDANDIEFVLAPPRAQEGVHSQTTPESPSSFWSDYLGIHRMWILDFDCCRPMSMDEAGLDQACVAFFKNDPFYPRPERSEPVDEELWTVFKRRFLSTSQGILKRGDFGLAERFIEKVEIQGNLRSLRKLEK